MRPPGPFARLRERRLLYVLVPHPDDEIEAWALVAAEPRAYPVFVLCTHGEATGFADGRGHQPELGEWTPPPQPWGPPGGPAVRAQRVASFHAFLDAAAVVDRRLADVRPVGEFPDGPSAFALHVGPGSARVVFDGGDGRLTPEFVGAALQRTRALRRTHLPVQRELAVVGSAYQNRTGPGFRYDHRDHQAVHDALWDVDQGVPGPQWCRTYSADRDAVRTERVPAGDYAALMALAPDGRRTGLFQRFYGWLGPAEGWPYGETDAVSLFSRRQEFWRRS